MKPLPLFFMPASAYRSQRHSQTTAPFRLCVLNLALYGKNTWAMSTYSSNLGTINNYILPFIGDMKLKDITPRVLEKYYQQLLKTKPVKNPITGKAKGEFVGTSTVRDVHKLLRN